MTAQEHANAIWRAEPSPEALAGAISAYTDELRGELHRVTAENAALREEVERLGRLHTSEGQSGAYARSLVDELRSDLTTARARIAELESSLLFEAQEVKRLGNEMCQHRSKCVTANARIAELEGDYRAATGPSNCCPHCKTPLHAARLSDHVNGYCSALSPLQNEQP